MDLSVVIPVLNEKKSLEVLLPEILQVLKGANVVFEVIVVDDSSQDGTVEYLRHLKDGRIHFMIRRGATGLASAVVDGASWAKANTIAVMDGDGQHTANDLLNMFHQFKAESLDLVIGARALTESENLALTKGRLHLSLLANSIAAHLLRRSISDPMSGFFIAKRQYFDEYGFILYKDGFKILFDLLYQIRNQDLKFQEIAIHFKKRQFGESKLNLDIFISFLVDVISKITRGVLSQRFIKFSIVGGSGILVHIASLYTALGFGVTFPNAQIIAIAVSLSGNYLLNNLFTFRDETLHGLTLLRGYVKYIAVNIIGAVANVGAATALYGQEGALPSAIAGILVGTTFNYILSKFFVWNRG
jgi:dolichol-phosphate mannosyltransferase